MWNLKSKQDYKIRHNIFSSIEYSEKFFVKIVDNTLFNKIMQNII